MHQYKQHKRRKQTDSLDEAPDSAYTTINFAGEQFFVLKQGGILGQGSQAQVYRAYRVLPDDQNVELVVLKKYYNNARANNELKVLQRLNKRCGLGEVGIGENQQTFVFEPLEDGKTASVFFKEMANKILDDSIDPNTKTEQFVKAIAIYQSIMNSVKTLHNEGIIHKDAHFDNFLFDDSTNRVVAIDFDKSELCEPLKLVRTYTESDFINKIIQPRETQALLQDYISVVDDLLNRERGYGLLSEKMLEQLPDNIALVAKHFRTDLERFVRQLKQDKCDKFSDYQRVEKLMSDLEDFIKELKMFDNVNKLTFEEQQAMRGSAESENFDFLDMLPCVPTRKEAGKPEHVELENVALNLSESQTLKIKG